MPGHLNILNNQRPLPEYFFGLEQRGRFQPRATKPGPVPTLPINNNRCLCASCKQYFGGVRTFEIHRVGPALDRACLGLAGMAERGLQLNAKGYWVREHTKRHIQSAPSL